jgi:hypothetical protein
MYTVAIPDDLAQTNMQNAVDEKLAKRWDYQSSSAPTSTARENTNTSGVSNFATEHSHSPFQDTQDRSATSGDDSRTFSRSGSESSRRYDLEEVRGLLNREPTRGRRRPAQSAPPAQSGYPYPHHI